ncbi:MAG: pro-sigmaK processing inhibitor BofA [Firmicutes bacterium]|jgi:inhibitor of the pro-sigma K processing machinery|nr:pro-sigmaK processing inhibitor BofA [Bacillota bacterium]HHT16137.1 pro-sigmaK processing inhibitor BofA [Papillibacter sp.]
MGGLQTTAVIILVALLALLALIVFRKPTKFILRLLLSTVLGFIALFVINFLGGLIGISIAVNWINGAIVGILGLPGIALLLILEWLTML